MKNPRTINPDYMWSWQVADMLGISKEQVNLYRKQGLLRAIQYKPRGILRYLREDVEKMLQRESNENSSS